MKNLVRGGFVLAITGLFVAFIYAQTQSMPVLSSANDSQTQLNNTDNKVKENSLEIQNQNTGKEKVTKTVSSRSTAGASRGSFTATAYCLKGRTAMGHGVRRGIIAADPRVLRLGSRINLGAGAYSGSYLVSDTGGKIKGRRLDIWMSSCSEARRFGRRTVSVSAL